MDSVHGLRCFHCNRPMSRRETHYAYRPGGGATAAVVGLECLVYIDGPEVLGLLDYAEKVGVAAARRHLLAQLRDGVKPERSEP